VETYVGKSKAKEREMSFSNIHWVAVLVSGLVGIASGAIWFGPKTFYPAWLKAMGKPENHDPAENASMGVLFGSTFVAQFVQAIALALILSSMSNLNMGKGALVGLVAGIGIAAASALGHRLFGGQGFEVWGIEVSNDILNLVLMGAILGRWH
jgi:hypothetical protein